MIKNKLRFFLLISASILLIIDIILSDFSKFWTMGNLWGLIAMSLLILSMALQIKYERKQKK